MKFLIDECLSPRLIAKLIDSGYSDAIHPSYVGLRGFPDHLIVARALDHDRIIVAANARDFRKFIAGVPIHPGLIILEDASRIGSWRLLEAALGHVRIQDRPSDYMVNRVIEMSATGRLREYPLPADS